MKPFFFSHYQTTCGATFCIIKDVYKWKLAKYYESYDFENIHPLVNIISMADSSKCDLYFFQLILKCGFPNREGSNAPNHF